LELDDSCSEANDIFTIKVKQACYRPGVALRVPGN
jgi:hypothetical protein